MTSDSELIDQIERQIIDGAALADILRTMLLLGGRLNSGALRDWAKSQLDGYGEQDEIPKVRIVGAPIYIDAIVGFNQIKHQHVSAAMLPDFGSDVMKDTIELRESIAEIESMIGSITRASGEVITITVPNWEAIGFEIDKAQEFQHTTRMYRQVHITQLENIVGDAKNRAAELLGEFRKTAGKSDEIPTGRKADAIVSGVVVTGSGNSVVLTSGKQYEIHATGSGTGTKGWWDAWGKAAAIVTVIAGVLTVVVWLFVALSGSQPPTP